jgi:hypothetical protein
MPTGDNLTKWNRRFLRLAKAPIADYQQRNPLSPCELTAARDEVTAKSPGRFKSTPDSRNGLIFRIGI